MSSAISIKNLQKFYGKHHALKGIDLEIKKGDFFGLLGPNGAGKSTLINILSGLVLPSSGNANVHGYDVIKDFRNARQRLGVVPQEIVQDVFFNIKELLYIQSGLYGIKPDKKWINELLDILQLSDKAKLNMRALSGGMKRRVMIAQAMVHKPPVIVLDEPTAGVDVDLRESLWNFITQLHRLGHTVVLTTHYLEEAQQLCNNIAVINQGKLVALDNKSDLIKRFGKRIFNITTHQSSQYQLDTFLGDLVISNNNNQVELSFNESDKALGDVLTRLHQADIKVTDIQVQEPSLQQAFTTLTKD